MPDIVFRRPPKGYKPARDRTIQAWVVTPCPICRAPVDQRCRSASTGKIMSGSHNARRRMAIRTLRERGDL